MTGRQHTSYDILGVELTAYDFEIHEQYRKLAKQYHPDRSPLNRTIFKDRIYEINEAYENLKTPQRREQYNKAMNLKVRINRADNDNLFDDFFGVFRAGKH